MMTKNTFKKSIRPQSLRALVMHREYLWRFVGLVLSWSGFVLFFPSMGHRNFGSDCLALCFLFGLVFAGVLFDDIRFLYSTLEITDTGIRRKRFLGNEFLRWSSVSYAPITEQRMLYQIDGKAAGPLALFRPKGRKAIVITWDFIDIERLIEDVTARCVERDLDLDEIPDKARLW